MPICHLNLKIPTASENTNRISENTHRIYLKMSKCRLTRLVCAPRKLILAKILCLVCYPLYDNYMSQESNLNLQYTFNRTQIKLAQSFKNLWNDVDKIILSDQLKIVPNIHSRHLPAMTKKRSTMGSCVKWTICKLSCHYTEWLLMAIF